MKHNTKLYILLGAYLAQVIGFAFLYQYIHDGDRSALLFNSTTIEKQHLTERSPLESSLRLSEIGTTALKKTLTLPTLIREEGKTLIRHIPQESKAVLDYEDGDIELHISFTLGRLKELGHISIINKDHPEWDGFKIQHLFNPPEAMFKKDSTSLSISSESSALIVEEFMFLIREEIDSITKRSTKLSKKLDALEASHPQWGYTEYLYFSVTVLGGGSGDIIPNSSSVRQLVIVQYLISIVIICFLISWISITKKDFNPANSNQ